MDLDDRIQMGLGDLQFKEPTPIQEKSIPIALQGKDIIGAAQTGTGKTAAFVIPLLQKILKNPGEGTKALILSPTRELATQIDEQIFAIGYHTGISSATIIGGEDFAKQANAIRAGVDIIVATPGRLIDQMKVLEIDFEHMKFLVLDEADRMLDMGFIPDVTKIVSNIPSDRQTMLFSATMPPEIQKLAKDLMKDPEKVEIEMSKPADSVEQQVYFVREEQKVELADFLLDKMEWKSCIIFAATKRGVDQLGRKLKQHDIPAVTIHGDRDQQERNKALHSFKSGEVSVIVATDVLARGIDIDDVSIILNFDVPKTTDDYIHRIGRTGRYDKKGIAITFVSNKEQRLYKPIENKVGDQIRKMSFPDELKDGKTTSSSSSSSKSYQGSRKKDQNTKSRRPKPDKRKISSDQSKEKKKSSSGSDRSSKQDSKPQDKKRRPKPEPRPKPKDDKVKEQVEAGHLPVEVVEKAIDRNQRARKPAKGIWGIIKSFLPRIKS